MTLSNLKKLARLQVPGAKKNRVSPATLELIINEVTTDINARMRLLRTDDKFGVTADQYKYDLSDSSETVDRFFKIDKLGLWWNAGSVSSTDWRRLFPKTFNWLDKNFLGWRDLGSGDPIYYAKQGRYIITVPAPDTTLANGFWLYFIENARNMSSSSHYPFGYGVEIPEYAILTDVIIKGIEVWLKHPVGKKREGSEAMVEYRGLILEKQGILADNPDIKSDDKTKIHLARVC